MRYLVVFFLIIPNSFGAELCPDTTITGIIKEQAIKVGVPFRLLTAICFTESSLNPKAFSKHDGGSPSYGLCQIKLNTARHMGFKGKSRDLFKPEINSEYAARYLKYQHDRYRTDWLKTISAYNRGRYRGHLGTTYINKVLSYTWSMP